MWRLIALAALAVACLWASRMMLVEPGRGAEEAFAPPPPAAGLLIARVAGYDDDGEALLACAPGATLRTTAGGVRACCAARPSAAAPKCGVCEFVGDGGAFELSVSSDCPGV